MGKKNYILIYNCGKKWQNLWFPCIRHIPGIISQNRIHHWWHKLFSNLWLIFSLVQECLNQLKCLPLNRTASRRALTDKVLICNPVEQHQHNHNQPYRRSLTYEVLDVKGVPSAILFDISSLYILLQGKRTCYLIFTETKNNLAKLFTAKTKSHTKTM